jgi:hypothetical protein
MVVFLTHGNLAFNQQVFQHKSNFRQRTHFPSYNSESLPPLYCQNMARQRRNSIRSTPYRLRTQGKCVKMALQQCRYRRALTIVLLQHIRNIRKSRRDRNILRLLLLLVIKYYSIKTVIFRDRQWHGNKNLTFDSLENEGCCHSLRFKKQDLWRLSEALECFYSFLAHSLGLGMIWKC